MIRFVLYLLAFGILSFGVVSCKNGDSSATASAETKTSKPETPVTVGEAIDTLRLSNAITLNATASYLLKTDVKANTTGYITKMSIKLGDAVRRGQVLFGLQTKEARAIGNTINQLDPSFRFHGSTTVTSPATGFVAMVNHQPGDYVQEGEVLATISDASSFGFVTDVPFEYLQIFKSQKSIPVALSDGRTIPGQIAKIMPSADPISQTVKVLVKVSSSEPIPENLIGTISFSKEGVLGLAVPKSAMVTDETQSAFWVMKLIDHHTAIKVPVEKGVETDRWVQIKSGNIKAKDKVITSGNFGAGDTIQVQIEK